jgi:hypothetical protein
MECHGVEDYIIEKRELCMGIRYHVDGISSGDMVVKLLVRTASGLIRCVPRKSALYFLFVNIYSYIMYTAHYEE